MAATYYFSTSSNTISYFSKWNRNYNTAIFKEEETTGTIINNVITPILTFLGGGYVALGEDLEDY